MELADSGPAKRKVSRPIPSPTPFSAVVYLLQMQHPLSEDRALRIWNTSDATLWTGRYILVSCLYAMVTCRGQWDPDQTTKRSGVIRLARAS